MSGTGALSFSMADLYPNGQFGQFTTRDLATPSPEERNTLVDDQELAIQNQPQVSNQSHVRLFVVIGSIVAIMFLFNIKL